MKTKRSIGLTLFGCLALLSALQACGDDKNDNEKPPKVTPSAGTSTGASSGNAGQPSDGDGGTGNGSDGGNGNGNGNEAGVANESAAGQGGTGPIEPECTLPERGEDDCFNCPKNGEVEQWLNRCVESECVPFDNAARLPLLEADGTLPDLPN